LSDKIVLKEGEITVICSSAVCSVLGMLVASFIIAVIIVWIKHALMNKRYRKEQEEAWGDWEKEEKEEIEEKRKKDAEKCKENFRLFDELNVGDSLHTIKAVLGVGELKNIYVRKVRKDAIEGTYSESGYEYRDGEIFVRYDENDNATELSLTRAWKFAFDDTLVSVTAAESVEKQIKQNISQFAYDKIKTLFGTKGNCISKSAYKRSVLWSYWAEDTEKYYMVVDFNSEDNIVFCRVARVR
jgi:hypothetical protein